ncbi:hypothetical protein PGO_001465, partial [Plasmodium gonderi]
ERPHGHLYQGRLYGENIQQHTFLGEGMHQNNHRQPFIYEHAEEPRRKKKKKKGSTGIVPKMEETNDEKNKSKPKKKQKKTKDGQTKRKNPNQDIHHVGYNP